MEIKVDDTYHVASCCFPFNKYTQFWGKTVFITFPKGVLAMTTAMAGTTPGEKRVYILPSNVATQNLLRLNMHPQRSIVKEDTKISHCGSRSPKYIKLGHFTLLFCRGRQRNVQSFKTYVHSYCSGHQTFCLATFPLPSPSWFAKTPF